MHRQEGVGHFLSLGVLCLLGVFSSSNGYVNEEVRVYHNWAQVSKSSSLLSSYIFLQLIFVILGNSSVQSHTLMAPYGLAVVLVPFHSYLIPHEHCAHFPCEHLV